jgi:hypothetical protein
MEEDKKTKYNKMEITRQKIVERKVPIKIYDSEDEKRYKKN